MTTTAVLRPDQYEELASFMAGFPGVRPRTVAAWRSRLSTWWELNPAFDASFPRGWLLRDDGRIVGFFGSIPLKIQLDGAETIAFAATSWRVLPEYRGQSIGLKLRQLQAHKEQLHFSTTPKEELVALLTRLGYRPIARGQEAQHQSLAILDVEKFLRLRFRNGFLGAAMAKLATPAFAAVQSFRTRGLGASVSGEVRELSVADVTFDDLWRRTRTRYANTNVRTAEMVNWYCFAMKPIDKKLLGYYRAGRLLGYMTLLNREEPTRRLMECVDVWIDPIEGEADILSGLVAKARQCAREGDFERVIFPHFDANIAGLYGGLGLIQGAAWKKREYIKGPSHVMETITPDNSYFVRAQGDYGL